MDIEDDAPPYLDEIVSRLVLKAGELMEDVSLQFALKLPPDHRARLERLEGMSQVTEAIALLTSSAVASERIAPLLEKLGRSAP